MKLFRIKQAKQDYTESMLPHNRREVFFDVLKLYWSKFLLYGILMLICSLPLIFIFITQTDINTEILNEIAISEAGEQLESLTYKYLQSQVTFALLSGLCWLPVFIFLSGLSKVIRQHGFEECVVFRSDCADGFKSNCLQMLPLGIIFSACYAFSWISYSFSQEADSIPQCIALVIPIGIFILVLLPITMYSIPLISVYSNKFGRVLKTAFIISVSRPLPTLLALTCTFAIFALLFVKQIVWLMIFCIIIALLSPTILFGWFLFCFDQFDIMINKNQYPELVGRGTFPKEPKKE